MDQPVPSLRALDDAGAIWRTPAARPWIFLAFALVILGGAIRLAFLMSRSDRFEDDQRQHVFWAYREGDPELFKNDLVTEHYASSAMAPLGYKFLHSTIAKMMDAQLGAEIGASCLMLIGIALIYKTGKTVTATNSPIGGVVALLTFFLLSFPKVEVMRPFLPAMLQRSFEPVLTMLTLIGLVRGRVILVGFTMLLAALVYPIALANIGLSTLIVEGTRLIRTRTLPRGWLLAAILAAGSIGVLAARHVPEKFGALITAGEAREMPIFQVGGRQQMFGAGATTYFFDQPETGLRISLPKFVAAMIVLSILLAIVGLRRIPFALWAFFAASVISWTAAHLLLFKLYMPGRHPKVAWFFVFAAAAIAPPLWEKFSRAEWGGRIVRLLMKPRVAWSGALIVPAVYSIGWGSIQIRANAPAPAEIRELNEFVKSLPKKTLLAGYPEDVDDIPLVCQRSVLVSRETALAFYMGFFREMEIRIRDCLAALYASDWAAVDHLHAKYGVNVFIVNIERFAPPYVEPWLLPVASAHIERGRQRGFVLKDPPTERVMFRRGPWTAVRVSPP
ncbi:MAG TPA: hypothetical protein VNT79_09075 [Phycisphaerae bacterium]|nr:hypothetical protein [Phycisphaerae bacterium]